MKYGSDLLFSKIRLAVQSISIKNHRSPSLEKISLTSMQRSAINAPFDHSSHTLGNYRTLNEAQNKTLCVVSANHFLIPGESPMKFVHWSTKSFTTWANTAYRYCFFSSVVSRLWSGILLEFQLEDTVELFVTLLLCDLITHFPKSEPHNWINM